MVDESLGPNSPVVSVRPGRNQLPDEDRALQDARRRLQRKKEQGGQDGDDAHDHGGGGDAHEDIHDDVSILGIPHDELTESVRGAIDTLLEEIQHLRQDLLHARSHEAYLEEQAEKDRVLHVMRRRAFMARINLAARHVSEDHVQYCFVYLLVVNAGTVRADFGHGAAEHLMIQTAEVLREEAEPGDVVGSLEQFDFGLLLPGTPHDAAQAKAQHMMQALSGRTFMWQNQSVSIQAAYGLADLAPHDTGDEVIERAKRDLAERNGAAAP